MFYSFDMKPYYILSETHIILSVFIISYYLGTTSGNIKIKSIIIQTKMKNT